MTAALTNAFRAGGIYESILHGPAGPRRLDAGETATMARELEYVFAEVYRREFPESVGRSLVPIKPGPGPGSEAHTFTEVEHFGSAKIVANYANDFPSTEVTGKQYTQGIRSIGNSYMYSVQDLRAAALTKIHMPTEKAAAAREAMESKLDTLVLSGDSDSGLVGLNSASLVSNYNAVTSNATFGANGLWSAATPAEVLHDVLALFKTIFAATLGTHRANTLVLDSASYNHIAFTFMTSTIGADTIVGNQTILQYLLANVPGLQRVLVWNRLDHAGATNKSRIFALDLNPSVLYQVIPQDFEQFPPQWNMLSLVVPCHMRWGGVVVPRPKAVAYMDGTGAAA